MIDVKVFVEEIAAEDMRDRLNAKAVREGKSRRFLVSKVTDKRSGRVRYIVRRAALGFSTVVSAHRVECHAGTGWGSADIASGARRAQREDVLRFWQSQGVARKVAGEWQVRDMVNPEVSGEWFPLATRETAASATHAELSHVRSRANAGAFCGCGLLPEVGIRNQSRGDLDMTAAELTPGARALLAAWPMWWRENLARPASLSRIA